jgi:enoyl-[acyl-carrier protein] reductase I
MMEAYRKEGARMGLLEGKNALVFGVANDHSIAWGIAQALHAEGATVGFSSIESLIDKRVRPLADSIGATFVEPADVRSDADIERVFARWGETTDHLDILVHALAFAKREDLEGGFVDTSRDGFALALDVSAYSLVALTRAARPYLRRWIVGDDADLLRLGEGRGELQRHGRREGRARGIGTVSRL